MGVAEVIAAERRALVERLSGLPEEDWERPTACAGWTVRHVVAHLTIPFQVSVPAMGLAFLRHRGISRGIDAATRRLAAAHQPAELLDVLAANAESRFAPPGLPLAAPLTDAVGHSSDIRWALGDPVADWGDPGRLRPVLDFLTGPKALLGFVPRGRLRGVALQAEDLDWSHGSGAVVRGPALLLAMGVLGRQAALAGLTGEGVARLRG